MRPSSLVLLAVIPLAPPLVAQRSPWITIEAGPQALREAVLTHYWGTLTESSTDATVGATLAAPSGWWLTPALSVRTTFDRALPFRSVALGAAIRTFRRVRFHLALARIQGSQPVLCLQSGSSCPHYGRDRRWGFEARVGWEAIVQGHASVGPAVWWVQSLAPSDTLLTQYRAIGIGLQIGWR